MKKIKDMEGLRFERLLVISFSHMCDHGNTYWKCKCDCGEVKTISRAQLIQHKTKSCGCLAKEMRGKVLYKHGHALSTVISPTYSSWGRMKKRCLSPSHDKYKYYGGRGIKICKRWHKFENFLADMGNRPKGLTLDRINNNKGYSKTNCKWSNGKEQVRNRRNTYKIKYNGEIKPVATLAEEHNLDYQLVWNRINIHKWSIERALTIKPKLGDSK